jgi:hypothetical protein
LKRIPPETKCNNCGDTFGNHRTEYRSKKRSCVTRKTKFVATNKHRQYSLPASNPIQPQKRNRNRLYFKATRLDGTPFADNSYGKYEPGGTYIPKPPSSTYYNPAGEKKICGPGYLHASQTPGATLVGGQWPARLFIVEGAPNAGLNPGTKWKAGFDKLTVVREVPAWRIFGRNGEVVAKFIEKMRSLSSCNRPVNDSAPSKFHLDTRYRCFKMLRENGYFSAYKQAVKYAGLSASDAILALMCYPLLSRKAFDTLYKTAATRIPIVKGLDGARLRRGESIYLSRVAAYDTARIEVVRETLTAA